MIKRIFLYIAVMMSLAACSDDIFDGPRDTIPENGEIPVSFNLPEMMQVKTRANTSGVSVLDNQLDNTVTMLMFDGPAGTLIETKELTLSGTGKDVTITIPKEHRKKNLYFMFYANTSVTHENIAEGKAYADVRAVTAPYLNKITNSDNYKHTVSGCASIQDLLQLNTVNLHRNSAKITVMADGDNTKTYPFDVVCSLTDPSLFSGSFNTNGDRSLLANYSFNKSHLAELTNDHNKGAELYVTPTNNTTGNYNRNSFIMMKAQVGEDWYYYRLDFQDTRGTTLDILPNHYYDVRIKADKITAGYPTPEEAYENPIPLSSEVYVIYDHAPETYNTITDGVRSLSVPHEINYTGTGGDYQFYVKLFDKNAVAVDGDIYNYATYKEFEDNAASGKTISLGGSFVRFKSIAHASTSGTAGTGIGSSTTIPGTTTTIRDGDTEGVAYLVTVSFSGGSSGTQEGEATFSWKGLTRKIDVIWEQKFDPTKMFKEAKSTVSGGSYGTGDYGNPSSNDYFTWLAGVTNDEGAYTTQPSVWGASAAANNDEARDQGLHFPMPYGTTTTETSTNPTKASYSIKLNNLIPGSTSYTWSYRIEGDPVFTNAGMTTVTAPSNRTITNSGTSNNGPEFTITHKGGTYEYGVARLIITVTENGKDTDFPINLYHTGFFHKDNTTYLAGGDTERPATGRDWTYYEVVSMAGLYWLDRNIGAHSAEMYVEGAGGQSFAGNQEAAGGYYRVAGYQKGGKPIMRENSICPPGFDYPTKDEYDAMRNSSNFTMPAVSNYYDAKFNANLYDNGTKQKEVHFPKSRYLDTDNAKGGEARAGYFWTRTAASGLEKEEVGAWLVAFSVTGSISTYMNAEVYCDAASVEGNATREFPVNGHAMSVRCVANKGRNENATERTSFFVKGATHVFLYTLDSKGKKNALTDWPGYQICTSEYADANKKFNFAYESKTNTPDVLYVIFNYKGSDGVIQTISRNAATDKSPQDLTKDKTVVWSNDKGADDLAGFKVTDGVAPDMNDYGNAIQSTGLGVTWSFEFKKNSTDTPKGGIGEATIPTKDYRIYFPQSQTTKFYLWYENSGNHHFFPNDGLNTNNTEGSYYYADFSHQGDENYELRMSRGKDNNQYDHDDKWLGKTLADFRRGDDGVYYAYIDESDVFHPGKPEVPVYHDINYILYIPTTYSKFYMWYDNGNSSDLVKLDNMTGLTTHGNYYVKTFTCSSEHENKNLNRDDGNNNNGSLNFKLSQFEDNGSNVFCAYYNSSNTLTPGVPEIVVNHTYKIKGTIFDNNSGWIAKSLEKKSNTLWEGELIVTQDGQFGIQQVDDSGNETAWFETTSSITISSGTNTYEATKSGGTKFNIKKGTYKFSVDISSISQDKVSLTVTKTQNRYGAFPDGTTFSIHSSMTNSDWSTVQMNDNDEDGIWEITITATQENWAFIIKTSDSSQEWLKTDNSTVSFGTPMTVKVGGNNNWTGSGKNKYTFKFSPSMMKLTVDEEVLDTPIPSGKAKVVLYKKPTNNWTGNVCLEYENSSYQKSGWGEALTKVGTTSGNYEIYEKIVDATTWNVNVNNGVTNGINQWCNLGNQIGSGNTVYIEFDKDGASKTSKKTVRRRANANSVKNMTRKR